MSKHYILAALSFLLTSTASSQDIWVQRDSVNGPPKANCVSFVIGDDGFIATGYNGSSKKRSMYSYDIDQDDWDDEVSMGGISGDGLNRTSAIGFSCDNWGFVGLGEGDGYVFQDMWMYDKVLDTWTQMADFEGPARTQAVGFHIGSLGFVGLGKGGDFATLYNDFWKFDYQTNTWTQVSSFPGTARMDAVGIDMVGKGYVGLGYDGTSYPNDFWEYFPETDTWTAKANFPGTPRGNATGFAVFPQLWVTTGDDGFNYLKDTWEYNYFGDTWTQRADFPGEARSGASSVVIENRGFVGCGFGSGVYYDDFYEYTILLENEEIIELSANVFPNPASAFFTITLNTNIKKVELEIYNSLGQKMNDRFTLNKVSDNTIEVSFSQLNKGTYYLAIFDDNEMIINQSILLSE
jgi:hypothetical protein